MATIENISQVNSAISAYLSSTTEPTVEGLAATINSIAIVPELAGTTPVFIGSNPTSTAAMGPYKMFQTGDWIPAKDDVVTTGLFTGDEGSLNSFFTSSVQAYGTSGIYYWNVYQSNPSASSSEIQFAVSYGNVNGDGSENRDSNPFATFPTKAIYGQYRTLLLDGDQVTGSFQFLTDIEGISVPSDDIYVINFSRQRYREHVDAGNIEFNLSGSNGVFTFIDDSDRKFSDSEGKVGRLFNIVSGSLNLGTDLRPIISNATASNGEGYGLFYPDLGIIILNPSAIHDTIGTSIDFESVGGASISTGTDEEKYNHALLFNALKGGADFEARRTEIIESSHYFIRVTNREFNYSNNPTFRNVRGDVIYDEWIDDPKVFITTVGLYNSANELLAVGKVSQPIAKDFSKEVLIKIRLDF